MKKILVLSVLLILTSIIFINDAFGKITDSIIVTTDKTSYEYGDTILISGEVQELLPGYPVGLTVTAPNGILVSVEQIDVNTDKTFSMEINTINGLWKYDGRYTINVIYESESRIGETTFTFSATPSSYPTPSLTEDNSNTVIKSTSNKQSDENWIMIIDETDEPDLQIKNAYDYTDDIDYLHIVGEITNNQNNAYEFVRIVATIYDVDGNVLDTEFSYTTLTVIPPYGKSPFDITFSGGGVGVNNYKLQVEASPAQELPMALKLTKPRIFSDDIGYFHIVGEVTNKGQTTANFVKIIASLYDSEKNLIGTGFSYAEFSDIYSGQTSPFEVTVGDVFGNPDYFQLYVESQEYGLIFEKPLEKTNNQLINTNTIQQNDKQQITEEKLPDTEQTSNASKGGCLIATATYGSELAPQVQQLRELRDNSLLQTESGTSFMTGFNQFYYSFSPTIADWERENPIFKEAVKIAITPMLSTLSIMTLADSEAEVLGLGLSVIALNIGMYFVAPAIVIAGIRKKFQDNPKSLSLYKI